MFSKKNTGTVENSGDNNNITNLNQINNIDNSKRNYRLMIYVPLVLAVSATVVWKIGLIKLPYSSSQTEFEKARSQNQSSLSTKKLTLSESSNLKIVFPKDEVEVPQRIEVKGVFDEISPKDDVWIYVYATGEQRYYPHKVRDIDMQRKTWSISSIPIGNISPNQTGNKWRIGVFIVGQAESDSLIRDSINSTNGVATLPVKIEPSKETIVMRIPGS